MKVKSTDVVISITIALISGFITWAQYLDGHNDRAYLSEILESRNLIDYLGQDLFDVDMEFYPSHDKSSYALLLLSDVEEQRKRLLSLLARHEERGKVSNQLHMEFMLVGKRMEMRSSNFERTLPQLDRHSSEPGDWLIIKLQTKK